MSDVLNALSTYPIKTRLSLTGTLVVARDIAHAKLQERLDNGEGLPQYMKDHPVYYAGPAKTPEVNFTGLKVWAKNQLFLQGPLPPIPGTEQGYPHRPPPPFQSIRM